MPYRNSVSLVYRIMVFMYSSAPGCPFKPTKFRNVMQRHLARKAHCDCKSANWTLEDACMGQQKYRSTNNATQNNNGYVAGENISNVNNNTINNITINLNVSPSVLASGSQGELKYLEQHAAELVADIRAGSDQPGTEMIERTARIAWCSDEHPPLNNVVAVRSNGSHQYLVLQDENGKPGLRAISGRDSPAELGRLAMGIFNIVTRHAARGHDPTIHTLGEWGTTFDSKHDAEAAHRREGRGEVMLVKRWGTEPHQKGMFKEFWVNMKDHNSKPVDASQLEKTAINMQEVKWDLRKPKARKRIDSNISVMVRQDPQKRVRRQRLQAVAFSGPSDVWPAAPGAKCAATGRALALACVECGGCTA